MQPPPHFPPIGVDAYHRLFADAGPHLMAGEASTNYLYSTTACSRIHESSAHARVLVILRDPVDRAYSEYWHFRRYGMEALTFDACIAEDDARDPHRRYIARGFYSHHVERYQRTFGADGVHGTRLGNNLVEKVLGTVATTRNPTVLRTLVERWC